MKHIYSSLSVSILTLFTACSAPQAQEEAKADFAPKVFANSLGMVITNTDKFAYKNLVFTLKPVGGKAVFFYKEAALDTAQRLGLRWHQFATKDGGTYPHKLMQAEKVTVEVKKPDGKSTEASFDIDPNAI